MVQYTHAEKHDVSTLEHADDADDQVTAAQQDTTYDISEEALGNDLPPNYYRSPAFIGTVLGLSSGYMSEAAGWSLSSNLLTLMSQDLGGVNVISWVALSNTLATAVCFLLVGRLSDIFGRRWFMIGGNLCGMIGSVVAATASSVGPLIVGNTLIGLGAAVQISFTVVIPELVANKHRSLWIAGILLTAFPLLGLGPFISTELGYNTSYSWRWCYWIAFVLSVIAVILLFLCYHPPNFHMLHKRRSKIEQLKRVDFIGIALFSLGLILLLMGLNWGGVTYPWDSAHVIATIVCGFFTLVLFVFYDNHVHKGDPLLPIYLLKSRGYIAMTLTAAVAAGVFYGMSVLWPQQVGSLFPGSLVQSGFQQCVLGIGIIAGQGAGGALVYYFRRHHRLLLVASAVCLTAFSASMLSVNVGERAKGVSLMLIASISAGLIETTSLSLAPLSCPPEDLGVALGALGSIRSAGGSVCVAIYITILNNEISSITPEKVTKAASSAGLPHSSLPQLLQDTSNLTNVPGINTSIANAVNNAVAVAAADSFHYVWYAVTAFGVLSIVVACLTISNYEKYMTDDVSRKLQTRRRGAQGVLPEIKATEAQA